jgi:hypothetical protein
LSGKATFVTVYLASGQPEAQIIKGRLESEGIPSILRYESAGLVYGLTINGLGQVEVQVPSSLAQHAKEILAAGEAGNTKLSDQAPDKEP